MSEEITQNVSDPRPFEERVLTLLDSMNTRLRILEEQSERRAMDTKPIWERALAEILEVKEKVSNLDEKVSNVERKFDVLTLDMMQLRGDQRRLNGRMDKIESKPV
jgi:FtsZ-binding cell division protein ZapB